MTKQPPTPRADELPSLDGRSARDGAHNRSHDGADGYESFVEEYYQPAYRFAFSLCGNHHNACDIAQQSFYLAHVRSHQLRDAAKRKQWLFTIIRREFLRTRHRESAHPQISLEFSEPELPRISVDHATSLDSKAMLVVLETLNENFKMPLVLFYLNQFSYKEIAATLEVPIGTVMSRLARGKQMLRERLETHRVDDGHKIIPLKLPEAEEATVG